MKDPFRQLEADPAYWRGRAATRYEFAGLAESDSEQLHHMHQGVIYERIATERAREVIMLGLQPMLISETPTPRPALRAAG